MWRGNACRFESCSRSQFTQGSLTVGFQAHNLKMEVRLLPPHPIHSGIVQSVEHLNHNQKVVGATPTATTKFFETVFFLHLKTRGHRPPVKENRRYKTGYGLEYPDRTRSHLPLREGTRFKRVGCRKNIRKQGDNAGSIPVMADDSKECTAVSSKMGGLPSKLWLRSQVEGAPSAKRLLWGSTPHGASKYRGFDEWYVTCFEYRQDRKVMGVRLSHPLPSWKTAERLGA